MIFLLDNYDSFTFNLVQRIGEIDPRAEIRVERNDQITLEQIEDLRPERIIISPGPCTPAEAGLSRELIAHFAFLCWASALGINVWRRFMGPRWCEPIG
jgi:anthranilate synthase component 2